MSKLICITGMAGAGKSIASDYFVKKGFQYLRFGQLTLDELVKRKLQVNEANERKIREEFRKKHGMAAFAILNLPKFKTLLKKGNVIGDGLYSLEEYKVLKKEFGKKLIVIAVYAPPELRYKRLTERKAPNKKDKDLRYRSIPKKDSESRDFAELEKLNKGGTIAMSDYTVVNTKSLDYFKKQLNEIHQEIEKKN